MPLSLFERREKFHSLHEMMMNNRKGRKEGGKLQVQEFQEGEERYAK
jgi:hypothetical protein